MRSYSTLVHAARWVGGRCAQCGPTGLRLAGGVWHGPPAPAGPHQLRAPGTATALPLLRLSRLCACALACSLGWRTRSRARRCCARAARWTEAAAAGRSCAGSTKRRLGFPVLIAFAAHRTPVEVSPPAPTLSCRGRGGAWRWRRWLAQGSHLRQLCIPPTLSPLPLLRCPLDGPHPGWVTFIW